MFCFRPSSNKFPTTMIYSLVQASQKVQVNIFVTTILGSFKQVSWWVLLWPRLSEDARIDPKCISVEYLYIFNYSIPIPDVNSSWSRVCASTQNSTHLFAKKPWGWMWGGTHRGRRKWPCSEKVAEGKVKVVFPRISFVNEFHAFGINIDKPDNV